MIFLSPKDQFLAESLRADAHGELCRNPNFHRACMMAWAEFTYRRSTSVDGTTGLRLDGARQFLEVLLNMGEPPESPKQPKTDQLIPT